MPFRKGRTLEKSVTVKVPDTRGRDDITYYLEVENERKKYSEPVLISFAPHQKFLFGNWASFVV